jgi:CubicO group peptidase (beta-lactamase class C family)
MKRGGPKGAFDLGCFFQIAYPLDTSSGITLMAEIHGYCDPRFATVQDAFASSFDDGLEKGASLSITEEGETVVDLWGGTRDENDTAPWEEDTVVLAFSTTKIMTALCGLMVIDRGLLDPTLPVAHYWPEFAAHGKDRVLVSHVFAHSAGLPCAFPAIPFDLQFDWDAITRHYADQELWWEPGTAAGYHIDSFGFLIGELIRRTTGMTPGVFLKEEICNSIGADFRIGMSVDEQALLVDRYATIQPIPYAPSIEELPPAPVNPEKVLGDWFGATDMGQFECHITLEGKGLHAVLRGPEGDTDVTGIRFDGSCLRMTYQIPTWGLVTIDGQLESDQIKANFHVMGSVMELTLTRQQGMAANSVEFIISQERRACYMDRYLPPRWGPDSLTSELPSSNGIGNARSVARIGSILANHGVLDGHRFLSEDTVNLALTEQSYLKDVMWLDYVRYGFGVGLHSEEFECPGEGSMHWGGYGGSFCIMDTRSRTCVAYAPNGTIGVLNSDPRSTRILEAYNPIARAIAQPAG